MNATLTTLFTNKSGKDLSKRLKLLKIRWLCVKTKCNTNLTANQVKFKVSTH